ncbi:MAG TPA: ABC transporter ATP-binding protein [Gemmatimonadaceae bacterium]|nr:ABC transporter ATP-binding protein [Gemmatimonadaceae bacterium]
MSEQAPEKRAPSLVALWIRHFIPLLHKDRRGLAWASVAIILDAILTVFRPWPLKVVIDRVLAHKPTRVPIIGHWLDHAPYAPMTILYGACATTMLIAISTGLLTYVYTRILGDVGQNFVFVLRRNLFAHMQRLSLRFHDRQRTGDLITRLTGDVGAMRDVVTGGAIMLGSNACLLLGMLTLMVWLNWRFALAALSVSPLLFWSVFRYTTRIKQAARRARVSDGLLASVAQETLASIRVVQGLAQEEQQINRFQVQNHDSHVAHLVGVRFQAFVAPLVDVLAAGGLAIVMWYGARSVLAGELTTGDVVVFFAYVTNLYAPIKALARLSYSFNRAGIGAERVADVLQVESEVRDAPDAFPAPRLRGEIELRRVEFQYVPGQPVLGTIDLHIRAGERIAIVGSTGAGKSTLVSLIPRLYDPSAGEVLIDGTDVRDFTVQSLRDQMSLVLQDSLLFSGTIRENIAFGRVGASDADIERAARVANAAEFIDRLPDGYDTQVAERGTTLSGGQKQRIAIARAILRDAPILILDEPTSGLDAASEQIVVEALERAAQGRTTLTIAHRLTTIRFADRIVVLEGGRIVEVGTHAELLGRRGRYADFCKLQLAV